jgi:hypothetical protein
MFLVWCRVVTSRHVNLKIEEAVLLIDLEVGATDRAWLQFAVGC